MPKKKRIIVIVKFSLRINSNTRKASYNSTKEETKMKKKKDLIQKVRDFDLMAYPKANTTDKSQTAVTMNLSIMKDKLIMQTH